MEDQRQEHSAQTMQAPSLRRELGIRCLAENREVLFTLLLGRGHCQRPECR
jgi:hypothetical protein